MFTYVFRGRSVRKSDEIIHVYFVGAKEQTDLVLVNDLLMFNIYV